MPEYRQDQAEQTGKFTLKAVSKKVDEQGQRISDTYMITVLGFIVLVVMVASVVITMLTWAVTSIQQISQQTVLLQQIKDKTDGIK